LKPSVHNGLTPLLLFKMFKGWGEDVVEIALRLSGLPKASGTRPRVVVVTQGARPTIVATTGEASEYPVEQLPNELIVDINGVGDAFVGGFVAKLIQGRKNPPAFFLTTFIEMMSR
jgi:adenosine kinase